MDKVNELRELKKLLDENVITEEEFSDQKCKLLGIEREVVNDKIEGETLSSNSDRTVEEMLKDYEDKLNREACIEDNINIVSDVKDSNAPLYSNPSSQNSDVDKVIEAGNNVVSELVEEQDTPNSSANEQGINYADNDKELFDKEKIKHLAKLEAEEEIKNRRRASNISSINKGMSKVTLIFKWLLTIVLWLFGVFSLFSQSLVAYKFASLIIIIEGCFACPWITEFVNQKEPVFAKYKTIFVILGIVLFFVILAFPG